MHTPTLLATALIATIACGCRCDGEPVEDPASDSCAPPVAAPDETHHPITKPSDVTITVRDAGQEPRRKLRYELSPGPFAFEVLPIRTEGDPGDAGGMTIYVEGKIVCSHDDRTRIDYRLGLRGRVEDGARAYALMDARGNIRDGGLIATVPVDPAGVTHPREGLPIPLPEQPVGSGATWIVSRTLDNGVRQNTTFEVRTMADDHVDTRILVDGAGATPLPPATGEVRIDLRSPVTTGWFLFDAPDGQRAGLRVVRR